VRTQILRGGKVVDEYHTPLGVRSIHFDAQKGFSLNGASMKLKGVCLHDDAGVLGAAVPRKVWEFRLKKLRDAGCNAIRTSHNPPPPDLLDLCDRMGFLVMDEAFDEWTRGKKKWVAGTNKGQPSFDGYHTYFDRWAETDLRDMVLRDRNHPSIILWSIGNEIDYKNDPYPPNSQELPPVAAALIRVVKQFDPTRPTTAACASVPTNLFCDQLDVVGYNYQEQLYAPDHAAHPWRVLYGSENYHRSEAWQAVVDNEFIAGQFLWTGADYLGESGGWPGRGSLSGMLDLAGLEKSMYYFRQSLWTDAPMVHLRPSPNGFICYTNCDAVELFEDGHSLGEQPSPAATRVVFWRSDRPGHVYKAVGKKSGATACEFVWKKPAGTAKLAAKTESTTLTADGRDVAVIEVTVTDAEGNPVMNAGNAVSCTVDGPGRLLGIENGDINNHDTAAVTTRNANRGRLVVYVQSAHTPGHIETRLSADGLQPCTVNIPSN
jgi:beta-galactosidase